MVQNKYLIEWDDDNNLAKINKTHVLLHGPKQILDTKWKTND